MTYIPKDYWMICDHCGGKFRRSEMRKQWTGSWTCVEYCWTPRHPQDFVKTKPDNPTVPVARPDVIQTVAETTLNGALSAGALSATLTSDPGLSDGDSVGIVMDNSIVFWTFIDGDPAASVITLGSPLHFAAASGNTVYLPTINNENWQ